MKDERVNFYSKGGDVLLLELSSQVSFNECGLSGTTVTDKHKLEGGHVGISFGHGDLGVTLKNKYECYR